MRVLEGPSEVAGLTQPEFLEETLDVLDYKIGQLVEPQFRRGVVKCS